MKKKKKKKDFSAILLVLIFFVGLSVLLYPTISDYVNSRTQSRAISSYNSVVEQMDETDYETELEKAREYNDTLWEPFPLFYAPYLAKGYDEALNVTGNGIMGYLDIDKLNLELPIYHGTSDEVLNRSVGHLEGSSLPVGGENTHCVLSAHRGLPSASLFSDLDELEVGDTFRITVLNQVLTYEVDQIKIVVPQDVDDLQIIEGGDYCTLMTCTPYGINTHRLLVRGKRISETVSQPRLFVTADAYRINTFAVMVVLAVPMVLILLIALIISGSRRKKKQKPERFAPEPEESETTEQKD